MAKLNLWLRRLGIMVLAAAVAALVARSIAEMGGVPLPWWSSGPILLGAGIVTFLITLPPRPLNAAAEAKLRGELAAHLADLQRRYPGLEQDGLLDQVKSLPLEEQAELVAFARWLAEQKEAEAAQQAEKPD